MNLTRCWRRLERTRRIEARARHLAERQVLTALFWNGKRFENAGDDWIRSGLEAIFQNGEAFRQKARERAAATLFPGAPFWSAATACVKRDLVGSIHGGHGVCSAGSARCERLAGASCEPEGRPVYSAGDCARRDGGSTSYWFKSRGCARGERGAGLRGRRAVSVTKLFLVSIR